MSTAAEKLMAMNGIKADLFAATREKGLDTAGRTLENLHELWGGISGGGALQAKTAVPSNVDVEVTPDDVYAALSAVTIAEAPNLKPWNIRKGKTLFGVTGTADIAVTTEVPSDIPVSKEDADTAYEDAVGSAPKDEDGNDLDMMTLADDNGNITYGYFLTGSASGKYLYNGVELPDINAVWTDKETYPYAHIGYVNGSYYLHVLSSPAFINEAGRMYYEKPAIWQWWYINNNTWELKAEYEDSGTGTSVLYYASTCIWVNHNLFNADGTTYLAASDPIPVGGGFTITSYDPSTTNFAAVGWRRLSYHTTGELAGQWTYDDFSTTASSGGNFLKNIIQCSREKLYYNGAEVWPNPDQSAITAEEVTT